MGHLWRNNDDVYTFAANLMAVEALGEEGDYTNCVQYMSASVKNTVKGLEFARKYRSLQPVDHTTWNTICSALLKANQGAQWLAALNTPAITQSSLESFDDYISRFSGASDACCWGQALTRSPPVDWRTLTTAGNMDHNHIHAFKAGAAEPYRSKLTALLLLQPVMACDFQYLCSNAMLAGIEAQQQRQTDLTDVPGEPALAVQERNGCFKCGRTGHSARDCRDNGSGGARERNNGGGSGGGNRFRGGGSGNYRGGGRGGGSYNGGNRGGWGNNNFSGNRSNNDFSGNRNNNDFSGHRNNDSSSYRANNNFSGERNNSERDRGHRRDDDRSNNRDRKRGRDHSRSKSPDRKRKEPPKQTPAVPEKKD